MHAVPRHRAMARLRDPQMLRDLMEFHGLNLREMAEVCGHAGSRSTIGNLHSGFRLTCTLILAKRIAKVLRVPPHHLFDVDLSTSKVAHRQKVGSNA
jgi:antitoxin component HigA of HigAB toxin-antitoxin module